MEQTYFANLSIEEIGGELDSRVSEYYEQIRLNGRLRLWSQCHKHYYSLNKAGLHDASSIQRGGEQGELSIMRAAHFRNLLQHLIVLITQQRPTLDTRARDTSTKARMQAIFGKNVIEYYFRVKREETKMHDAAEGMVVYGEYYLELGWDKNAGTEVAADLDLGKAVRGGDVWVRGYEPINVIRPIRHTNGERRLPWYILKSYENKWELAAEFPERAEEIIGMSPETSDETNFYYSTGMSTDVDEDRIPVFTFYHEKTGACPTGRHAKFLNSDIVLFSNPLRAREVPVYPFIPSRQHGTSFGYSPSFDLVVVQEAIDLLYSTVLSNQAAFGVQNIWAPPGSNLNPVQLGGGLNLLESTQKPEAINLTQTPAEIFKFMQGLETLGETLSGVNSVARGQPEASLKSGSALAMVASQAVQFANGLQATMTMGIEDVGTAIINFIQDNAKVERIAAITGKNGRSVNKAYTGKDLEGVQRVICDQTNPMARTVSGRMQMATDLIQSQTLKDPRQYIQVVETGNLEPLIEDDRDRQNGIEAENEALRDGRPVRAIAIDNHKDHIDGHAALVSTPEDREDPELVQRVLDHIAEHVNALRTTDPALLSILGQQGIAPPPPPGAPTPGPQGQGAPQPNAKPQPGERPQPGEQMPAPPGAPENVAGAMPKLPQPPAA